MVNIRVTVWRDLVTRSAFSGLAGFLLFVAFLLMSHVAAYSQSWSGILDPSRAADWTKAGIPGGIPNRTTVCKTVAPSGHTNDDDMNAINYAIASCPEGQVVKLGQGTFTITRGLTFGTSNDVTLRGAGPEQTILKFTGPGRQECGGYASICLWGNRSATANPASYAGSQKWTGTNGIAGTYTHGATVLNLDSVSGLRAGQIIIIDQRNDDIGMLPSPNGATESGCTKEPCTVTITTSIAHGYAVGQTVGVGGKALANGYVGYFPISAVPSPTTFQYTVNLANLANSGGGYTTVDTNGVLVSGNRHITIAENLDVGRACPDAMSPPTCQANEISWRSQTEVKVVTAVDGVNKSITVSPGLYNLNWRTSQAPGLYWFAPTSGTENNLRGNYAIRDGVEDLTLDYTPDSGTNDNAGIELRRAYQCWVKNVRSMRGNRNSVWIRDGSMQNEVVDSYFVDQKGSASQSYAVEMLGATANNLIQNNICQHIVVCIMTGGSVGSVISYNYMVDDGYYVVGLMMPMLNANHDVNAFNLFEGNDSPGVINDNGHGTGNLSTFFRNRLRGQSIPVKNNNLIGTTVAAYNRGMNYIGNVLGTKGAQTKYEEIGIAKSGYVWSLDKGGQNGTGVQADSLVHQSLLRWGNYDVVTGTVRWCGNASSLGWSTTCNSTSEIPTVGIKFVNGNPVPSSTTLPPSFYLSAQPSFWRTPWVTSPWPAIGPEVRGGTAPDGEGGYSYAIPAQLCYLNTSIDPAYQQKEQQIRLFDAASCYPDSYAQFLPRATSKTVPH
jgi:hypothetical protein